MRSNGSGDNHWLLTTWQLLLRLGLMRWHLWRRGWVQFGNLGCRLGEFSLWHLLLRLRLLLWLRHWVLE